MWLSLIRSFKLLRPLARWSMLIFRIYTRNPVIVRVSRYFRQGGKIFLWGSTFLSLFLPSLPLPNAFFSPFPSASLQEVIYSSAFDETQVRHHRFTISTAISSNFFLAAHFNEWFQRDSVKASFICSLLSARDTGTIHLHVKKSDMQCNVNIICNATRMLYLIIHCPHFSTN